MPSIITDDHYFNHVTNHIFPARNLVKELIYWPTEIAAGILMFIYILQIDLIPAVMSGYNYAYTLNHVNITGDLVQSTIDRTFTTSINNADVKLPWGITAGSGQVYGINDVGSDLLNREYAWLCLCWMIKHYFYLLDTACLLFLRQFKGKTAIKMYDLLTPFMNCGIWTLWGIYGWIKSGDQIHAGMYYRLLKDQLLNQPMPTTDAINTRNTILARYKDVYSNRVGWDWLFVPTVCVLGLNFLLWCFGIIKKRSSVYTGQALSVQVIVAQLFFLHLFLKGSWVRSYAYFNNEPATGNTRFGLYHLMSRDYFDARWIWWCIYFAAYAGLLFALICFRKGINDMTYCTLRGLKWIAFSIFWVSGFIWILCMDNTLYHFYIQYKGTLVATHIICFATIGFIALVSIWERLQEGEFFWVRHNAYADWKNPHITVAWPSWKVGNYAHPHYGKPGLAPFAPTHPIQTTVTGHVPAQNYK